jgi:DNA-3-methyladenine glycosylase
MSAGFPDFLDQSATLIAPLLLGCILERQFESGLSRVRIVETEAYDQEDAASHSYSGNTARTAVMFGPSGFLYVYFTYGMHYCCNVVVGPEGRGEAVLIRAVEPVIGHELLQQQRPRNGIELANGPAKLCQALDIDRQLNGHDLRQAPLRLLTADPALSPDDIITGTRIGISKARDELRRFYIKDNPYVSKP